MALAHHSLVAWRRADDLFIRLHQLSLQAFPGFEKFELGSQLRRAAFSVPVNIVEGFAKRQGRARVNVLNISQSSLAEVGYCIHVAQRLGYPLGDRCRRVGDRDQASRRAAGRPDPIGAPSLRREDRRRYSRCSVLHQSNRIATTGARRAAPGSPDVSNAPLLLRSGSHSWTRGECLTHGKSGALYFDPSSRRTGHSRLG